MKQLTYILLAMLIVFFCTSSSCNENTSKKSGNNTDDKNIRGKLVEKINTHLLENSKRKKNPKLIAVSNDSVIIYANRAYTNHTKKILELNTFIDSLYINSTVMDSMIYNIPNDTDDHIYFHYVLVNNRLEAILNDTNFKAGKFYVVYSYRDASGRRHGNNNKYYFSCNTNSINSISNSEFDTIYNAYENSKLYHDLTNYVQGNSKGFSMPVSDLFDYHLIMLIAAELNAPAQNYTRTVLKFAEVDKNADPTDQYLVDNHKKFIMLFKGYDNTTPINNVNYYDFNDICPTNCHQ